MSRKRPLPWVEIVLSIATLAAWVKVVIDVVDDDRVIGNKSTDASYPLQDPSPGVPAVLADFRQGGRPFCVSGPMPSPTHQGPPMKARTTSHPIVLALALAAGGVAAQEATSDRWRSLTPPLRSRAAVAAEAQAALRSGALDPIRSYDIAPRDYRPTLTRAEVLADVYIWRASGLAAEERGEAGYNPQSATYAQARERYLAMRASPAFAALVQSIAQQRGDIVAATAGTP